MTEKELNDIHKKTGLSKRTLRMIEKGMKEVEKGNTSGPIYMEEDFPFLTDED